MTRGGRRKVGPFEWVDEILRWRRPDVVISDEDVGAAEAAGEAFSAALAEMGRQWAGGAPGWVLGPVAGSWSEPGAATPIDDERAMIERAHQVWVEQIAEELAWRSQADRYGKSRPGLVAEIERRCWALSRPR